jgi:uncharacterized protein YjaG (DUF416 family)
MTENKSEFFEYSNRIFENLKANILQLNDFGIIVFSTACCQRQISAYNKASSNQSWSNPIFIEQLLASVWECLLNDDNDTTLEIPDRLTEKLLLALPEDPYGDIDNCAISSVTSVGILFDIIESPNVDKAITISENALEIISTLLYSTMKLKITPISDVPIYSHRLMTLEIDRQINDISRLIKSLENNTIRNIFNDSIGVDLIDRIQETE